MIRISFHAKTFDTIQKDVRATTVDKLSHFGGTAGLFTGFSAISPVEFLFFFCFAFLIMLYEFVRNKIRKVQDANNVVDVQEFKTGQDA